MPIDRCEFFAFHAAMTTLGPVVPNQTTFNDATRSSIEPAASVFASSGPTRATQILASAAFANWSTYTGLFLIWMIGVYFLTGGGLHPEAWLQGWNKWDANWYTRIWNEGYGADPAMLAFPPGYPLLIGSLSSLFGLSLATTAFCLNAPAFFFAGGVFAQFGEKRFKVRGPWLFLFFLSAPSAYFAFAPYSDALFLLLFWLALPLAAKPLRQLSHRDHLKGAVLLLFMPWVRLTAYALICWVALRRWFALIIALSLLGWLTLNATLKGDPLFFLHVQSRFLMADGGFWTGLLRALSQFPPAVLDPRFEWTPWLQFSGLPVFYLALFAATAVWLMIKKEWLLALTLVSVTLFSHNQAFWRSVVRYDLVIAPLLAIPLLASARRADWLRWISVITFVVITLGGFAFQIYFAQRFRAGLWGF